MPCCIQNSRRVQNERSSVDATRQQNLWGWRWLRQQFRMNLSPLLQSLRKILLFLQVRKRSINSSYELAEDWWKYVYRQLIHRALTLTSLRDPQSRYQRTQKHNSQLASELPLHILKFNWMHQSHHIYFWLHLQKKKRSFSLAQKDKAGDPPSVLFHIACQITTGFTVAEGNGQWDPSKSGQDKQTFLELPSFLVWSITLAFWYQSLT